MSAANKTLTLQEAHRKLEMQGSEFIVLENPGYVHPAFEICPLAPAITTPRKRLIAIVQDMDGTTTTTENLCLYSLETMVRQITGLITKMQWSGFDKQKDYPHIIGNSTTKHVEYLVTMYGDKIDRNHFHFSWLSAAWLTMAGGRDENRKTEVFSNLKYFKCDKLISSTELSNWSEQIEIRKKLFVPQKFEQRFSEHASRFKLYNFSDQVRAAIDIYYRTYHEILFKIEHNDTADLEKFVAAADRHLIEPMPGIGIFLATVKGWLGSKLDLFEPHLSQMFSATDSDITDQDELRQIGLYFEKQPLKIALVTSSIRYEAEIVLTEVFRVIRQQIFRWPLPEHTRRDLLNKFTDYSMVFDSVVTASDSSEIRLKPHRDLYSLALHRLGIAKADFDNVIGFEDSESGTIALRAAGIGLCIALPFADTQDHDLNCASYILRNGLPEVILKNRLFLNRKTLSKMI